MRIKLDNLKKSYDGKLILKNLNLDIDQVTCVGIIGKSGCGKSTLLRQLSGIELPDEGSVTINKTTIQRDNLMAYQEKIGFVFQKNNLFPHLTIEQNILFILTKIKNIEPSKAKEICTALLEEFQLTEQADKIPSKVSGGQAQRASIARALCTKPELLFLDEPTAALDPLLTKEVLTSIQKLKDTGNDFVFITHELDFLRKFADYYIFMDNGRIIEQGRIEDLENPVSLQLKNFIARE
jgi:ABC-type polar amino acid transport system ATPase subunit